MYSGLFFLAPGVGFLAGSVVAGHLSDRCVVRYKARRDGVRLAEDRLNSSLPWVFIVLPLGTLLYGWSVDQEVGGMGLPISASFIQGFGLMAAFNGLNTYAAGKDFALSTEYEIGADDGYRGASSIQSCSHQWEVCRPILFRRGRRRRSDSHDRYRRRRCYVHD